MEEALSAVLPKGTSIVRGTTVTDQRALAKANAPAVAEGWSVAPRPGSGSEGRLQPIEIVNDAQTFETLTGRQWTDGERAALQSGRVLAPSPDYLAGDRVTLAVPSGGEKHDTSRKAAGVLVEEPVDDTTRSRAVAYVSASAVRAWGGLPVDYSVIATTGDQAPLAELDGKLAKALEPVTIPCPRCGSNAAPKGRRPPSGTPCSVSPSPRWQPHSASSSPLQRLNCGPISCVCTVSASPPVSSDGSSSGSRWPSQSLPGAGEDRTAQRWLEAHERWVYDDVARVQRLKRLICLCTDCHTVTHYGYAQVRGLESKAFAHLTKVTKMDGITARRHVDAAFATWRRRSQVSWKLDLSILTDAGIAIRRPPSAEKRPDIAAATLAAERDLLRPTPVSADAGEIVARIAVERGIALSTPSPAEAPAAPPAQGLLPRPAPVVPAPREDSPSLLQRLFRRST
ncbi:hypothetical protein [Streptomyces sp. WAC08241]|uniref:hypothetical protein n=1 Tax=Streptomyces sp. WAC08241 TaxID=2487421 RepID=UPI00163C76FD|nr:hypothetical protein [Streptomyces sp. WAC08241]